MRKTLGCHWRLLALGILVIFSDPESRAAVESLESPVLRVEITTSPYSFCVIEKSTGEHLTSQSGTAFTFASEFYPVFDVAHFVKSSDSVQADLLLELAGRDILPSGTPDKARVTFRFLNPQVVQVHITVDQPLKFPKSSMTRVSTITAFGSIPSVETLTIAVQTTTFLGSGTSAMYIIRAPERPSM
jgi:hypothetical protein